MTTKEDFCYSVYKHTTPSNKVYIGITSMQPEKRWLRGEGYMNQVFYRAIKKYGWDNIRHEILFSNLNKEDAEQKEIEMIQFHKSNQRYYGYNIENGGSAKGRMSNETKQKLSKINQGRFVGRKLSKQWIENRSKSQTGLKRSSSTKQKIKEANSRKVICINNRTVYNSLTDAAEATSTLVSHISSCCHKRRKSAGTDHCGNYLYWMFYNEYLQNGLVNKANSEIIPKRERDNKPKMVVCLNNKRIYDTIHQASADTGLSKSGISLCCNKKQKYCGKDEFGHSIVWMFYDEYIKGDD